MAFQYDANRAEYINTPLANVFYNNVTFPKGDPV